MKKSSEEEEVQMKEAPVQKKGSGSGMPAEVQVKMENSFGTDFSDVNIHANSNSATQMGALAYAQGTDVHFAPGQYNPGSQKGQELLGHELTHVVQQRQGRVQATTQAKGVAVNDDKGLEKEADVMGAKAARGIVSGNENAVQKKLQNNVVQKHDIEGPWNIKNPVHENLTLQSLIKAGIVPPDAKIEDKEVFEFIRGVMWNDDPEGLLFDNNKEENDNFSSGGIWYALFLNGERKSENGKTINKQDRMTERSHFGDFQFMHAMAVADKIEAEITKNKVMMWAEFTYRVGIGDIPSTTKLISVPVTGLAAYFEGTPLAKLTIDDLFHTHKKGSTPKRAMGSLLHMIQDSHAHGHTERHHGNMQECEPIESFHSYVNQDGKAHAEHDKGNDDYSYDGLSKLRGGKSAMDKGAVILKFYSTKHPWASVKEYLNTQVFNLTENPSVSGPGEEFKRKH